MNIHPVLLCGGSGARLWPASRPGLPKAFLALAGERSGFQETLLRVSASRSFETPIVVAGAAHQGVVARQLAALGLAATVILEPAPRDSGPAIAAAAAFLAKRDERAVALFLACDHHLADTTAFVAALADAVEGAGQGRVVTLGVAPTQPAVGFGYIRPGAKIGKGPLRRVDAFAEKPDLETARRYIAAGYLWNSGNFIVGARVLLDEIEAHAPALRAATRAGEEARWAGGAFVLSEAFLAAPRISIDYALMEKTRRAAVLPVSFAWSDLGAWDAVLAASAKDDAGNAVHGDCVLHQATGCVVRAGRGRTVIAVGTKNLAIVVEDDAVLVCDLALSAAIKPLVDALRAKAPKSEGPPKRRRWANRRGRRRAERRWRSRARGDGA